MCSMKVVAALLVMPLALGQFPGASLPFPEMPIESVVGATLKESVNRWPKKRQVLRKDAPNIVLILNDDAGYGAPDTFGGPVHTPSLTRLAEKGIAYNRFHTTAICSPTRAALLTGRNSHRVGAGQVTEFASAFPGYTGRIPKSCATVAKVLSGYGYDTAAFGKWHNTPVTDLLKTGPFDQYPTGLGFGYFYGFLAGETSQYTPRLFENTNPIEPPRTPEEGYHLTEDIADQAIKFIKMNRGFTPDRPFFIYFAPGATHGPHHIFPAWADKYKGRFDHGWEVQRNITFEKQKAMGWIPKTAELTQMDSTMHRWSEISEKHKAFQLRLMEVYAGFLEHTDTQHGKILDEIERQGIENNTLVIYVFADNGASAEGLEGTVSELLAENALPSTIDQQIEALEPYGGLQALGSKHVDNMYHGSWAWAMDTPFKSTKLVAAHFGGTRTPMVMKWPAAIEPSSTPRSQFHHVNDIVPTIYEAVGITPPQMVEGSAQESLDGVSMMYTWKNASAEGKKLQQYFEVMGSRGIYRDGWFAGTFGPRVPWAPNATRMNAWDPNNDVWELYDLSKDFTQARDLAAELPEKLAELKAEFLVEAAANQVLPIGAGLYTVQYHPDEAPHSTLSEWSLFQGETRMAESLAPLYHSGFASLATILTDVPANASGVLYCVGGGSGGFSVFMDGGYLHAEYLSTLLYRYKATSSAALAPGRRKIEVKMLWDKWDKSKVLEPAGNLTLAVDGKEVAGMRVDKSIRLLFSASESFDVGMDLGAPVSDNYDTRSPFPFTGSIDSLHIKYIPNPADADASQVYI
eukprot:gb/GFBE01038623.1/.p1 GENE.gb/GFBE01038623.1/~~gb/GFBE01038623.1/.p1  ORF type:complete len:802 (+),score=168.08 gb/GFBE01038623.1/:1-2406(+)